MLEVKKVIDLIKLSGKQAFILFIISSILLFSPVELITQLGLNEIKEITQPYVGVIWLVSLAVLFIEIAQPIYQFLANKVKGWSSLKVLHKRLENLAPDEKVFLKYYIVQNTRTQGAEYSSGVVKELEAAKIVRQASSMSSYMRDFAYNIQPWAWDHLKKNPDLLE